MFIVEEVVKEDKNVRRILARLGLIESENISFKKIMAVCEAKSKAVGENLNVIDKVFWACATNYCQYYKNPVKSDKYFIYLGEIMKEDS